MTPITTGINDSIFRELYFVLRNAAEIAMTKIGVAALTTWWNLICLNLVRYHLEEHTSSLTGTLTKPKLTLLTAIFKA